MIKQSTSHLGGSDNFFLDKLFLDKEDWIGLLTILVQIRCNNYREVLDNQKICAMIDSLCST